MPYINNATKIIVILFMYCADQQSGMVCYAIWRAGRAVCMNCYSLTFALRSKDHNKTEMLENSVPFWQQYKSMTRNWNATTIAYCRCHDHMGWWKAYFKETPTEIGTILLAVGKCCCVTKLGPLFALAQLWYFLGDSNVFDNVCNL